MPDAVRALEPAAYAAGTRHARVILNRARWQALDLLPHSVADLRKARPPKGPAGASSAWPEDTVATGYRHPVLNMIPCQSAHAPAASLYNPLYTPFKECRP